MNSSVTSNKIGRPGASERSRFFDQTPRLQLAQHHITANAADFFNFRPRDRQHGDDRQRFQQFEDRNTVRLALANILNPGLICFDFEAARAVIGNRPR